MIVTEWKEFKSPDFGHLKSELKMPVIFDGRNLYEPEAMAELGIDYYAIGRPHVEFANAERAAEPARFRSCRARALPRRACWWSAT